MNEYLNEYGFGLYISKMTSVEDQINTAVHEGLSVARIIAEHKSNYIMITKYGEMPGVLSGSYRYSMEESGESLTVGDFVFVKISDERDRAVISGLLPRKTQFIRRDTFSDTGVQLMCANFDTVFICMSLNKDFNLSRLERYLAMVRDNRAEIAVILTKSDLCDDVNMQMEITQAVCGGIPVFSVSAKDKNSLSALSGFFAAGRTVVAIGSSGVGKSTLVNAVFGQKIMEVSEIREDDDKGRHTTVHKQIILLPSGGLYMDTPGLRSIGLVDAEDAIGSIYSDVEAIIKECRFLDCSHRSEPGCAVKAAIKNGSLTSEQYESYLRLKKESAFLMRKETRKMIRHKENKAKRYEPGFEE